MKGDARSLDNGSYRGRSHPSWPAVYVRGHCSRPIQAHALSLTNQSAVPVAGLLPNWGEVADLLSQALFKKLPLRRRSIVCILNPLLVTGIILLYSILQTPQGRSI